MNKRIQNEKCEVCSRNRLHASLFCFLHDSAEIRVKEGFEMWKRAFDNMSWERYLDSILELRGTGDSSKEIARHLLRRSERFNEKYW